jgi:hypothetical protein
MKKDLVEVLIRFLTCFGNFVAELVAYTVNQIFTLEVFQHNFRITDYHHVGWYVVENCLELFFLITDHLLVEK